jgi:hypothetical protein
MIDRENNGKLNCSQEPEAKVEDRLVYKLELINIHSAALTRLTPKFCLFSLPRQPNKVCP